MANQYSGLRMGGVNINNNNTGYLDDNSNPVCRTLGRDKNCCSKFCIGGRSKLGGVSPEGSGVHSASKSVSSAMEAVKSSANLWSSSSLYPSLIAVWSWGRRSPISSSQMAHFNSGSGMEREREESVAIKSPRVSKNIDEHCKDSAGGGVESLKRKSNKRAWFKMGVATLLLILIFWVVLQVAWLMMGGVYRLVGVVILLWQHTYIWRVVSPGICWQHADNIFKPRAMVVSGWSGDPMCLSTAESMCSNWGNGGRLSANWNG